MAARLGVPEVYADFRELIARPGVDAITVATPDALHLPVAVAALEAGKHVFCEKPLAMNVAEARKKVEVADQSGRVAMVAFTFRCARALQELRRLLRQGAIGTPFYVALQVHWGGTIAPGTVHVSLLLSRVGRPREGADGIHVVGTRSAVHVSLTRGQHERVSLLRAGSGTWEDVSLPDDATTDQPLALVRMMGAFVDAVLRGHLDPEQDPGFVAGLHTQLALDAGLCSARSGRCEEVER
jgi:predicted dehydrogenase